MDQLKGTVVNVVLTIQEGKGMESLKNLTLISANFNGRVLESDPVIAEEYPAFNTNLIWEISKKELRKIRSSNQPLRVECLSIDNQNRREKFGHVLFDLRSAQIVEDSHQQVPFRWQKLLGVRNKKRNCFPELYYSLTIRNHTELLPEEPEEKIWDPETRLEGTTPIAYLEDGYILVGDHSESTEDFSLNILIKAATSLDLLLPESAIFQQNKNIYHMCFKVFGIPIKTKQFSKDLYEQITFEEKIVIRLLSDLQILKRFFSEEKFEITFNCSDDLLGMTMVSFDGVTNLNEKLSLTNCYFQFPSPCDVEPVGTDGRKPSIALEISLNKNCKTSPTLVENDVSKACGDYNEEAKKQVKVATEKQIKELEAWKEKEKVEHMKELEDWKEKRKLEYLQELEDWKDQQKEKVIKEIKDQLEVNITQKTAELNENIKRCKDLQDALQQKHDELNLSKTLKKKKKSSTNLLDVIAENQKKFADCDKELLIDYISNLQNDNDNLKQMINDQNKEIENMEKTALTKEQTANLLHELKGLEEKFEIAQQSKMYFKEQWQRACQEIHNLKSEDYRQLQNQLQERREELNQLDKLCIMDEPSKITSF